MLRRRPFSPGLQCWTANRKCPCFAGSDTDTQKRILPDIYRRGENWDWSITRLQSRGLLTLALIPEERSAFGMLFVIRQAVRRLCFAYSLPILTSWTLHATTLWIAHGCNALAELPHSLELVAIAKYSITAAVCAHPRPLPLKPKGKQLWVVKTQLNSAVLLLLNC